MDAALFQEIQADKAVIKSLLTTNRVLWEELETNRAILETLSSKYNRGKPMSKILQDENGVLYVAHKCELLTEELAHELSGHLQSDLSRVEAFLSSLAPAAPADQPVEQPAAPEQPAQPEQPAVPEAPATPEQPAESSQAPETPVDTSAMPAAAPEAPVQPNAASAPTEPATPVDPNALPPLQ